MAKSFWPSDQGAAVFALLAALRRVVAVDGQPAQATLRSAGLLTQLVGLLAGDFEEEAGERLACEVGGGWCWCWWSVLLHG
jgi:hypothetical protein